MNLPPLHALLKLCHPLPLIRLPEHVQMLMPNKIEIILLPEPPLPRALHLPLKLDYISRSTNPISTLGVMGTKCLFRLVSPMRMAQCFPA